MRDQRYYQRLNQIREKYGYMNEINPQQEIRQVLNKRQSMPVSPSNASINNFFNSYEIPHKSPQDQIKFDSHNQLLARRQKENISTPPILSKKNQIVAQRNYRDQLTPNSQEIRKYNYQKLQSHRPSISQYREAQVIIPTHLPLNTDHSSPIKRLQVELPNRNTPRQYSNFNERQAAITPLRINKNKYQPRDVNLSERSPLTSENLTVQYKKEGSFKRGIEKSSFTPERFYRPNTPNPRNPELLINQNYEKNENGQQYQNKYNFSINNIDKIQQKIQLALNKNKK